MSDPPVPETAITAVMEVLAAHRWKSMGAASVECECGAILYGPGFTQFPADEAFRRHLASVMFAAAAPHIAAAARASDEVQDDYEPFIATEGWREETSIRYVPESAIAKAVAEARASERERIRQLAIQHNARIHACLSTCTDASHDMPFADLIASERPVTPPEGTP